jgi:hypothetical protein
MAQVAAQTLAQLSMSGSIPSPAVQVPIDLGLVPICRGVEPVLCGCMPVCLTGIPVTPACFSVRRGGSSFVSCAVQHLAHGLPSLFGLRAGDLEIDLRLLQGRNDGLDRLVGSLATLDHAGMGFRRPDAVPADLVTRLRGLIALPRELVTIAADDISFVTGDVSPLGVMVTIAAAVPAAGRCVHVTDGTPS